MFWTVCARWSEDLTERPDEAKEKSDEPGEAKQTPSAGDTARAGHRLHRACARRSGRDRRRDAARRLTARRKVAAELLTTDVLKSEVLERCGRARAASQSTSLRCRQPRSCMPHFFCKRLRPRFPDLKIVVALWHAEGDMEKGRARLLAAGASEVVVTLKDSIEKLPRPRWSPRCVLPTLSLILLPAKTVRAPRLQRPDRRRRTKLR